MQSVNLFKLPSGRCCGFIRALQAVKVFSLPSGSIENCGGGALGPFSDELRAVISALEHFPMTLTRSRRHGRACPGHPRLFCGTKDVDARHKAGHDGG